MVNADTRGWIVDIVVGGVIGAIVGAIVAVNVAIYAGPDSGYESTIPEVFRHNTLTGIIVVATLVAGSDRRRRRFTSPPKQPAWRERTMTRHHGVEAPRTDTPRGQIRSK